MSEPERLGSYRLLRELGRGGQGVVWLAEDLALGRRVAVKLLKPGACDSAEALHRFLREAELASRLDHPGICAVYGSGIEGRRPWFAMRHVEGESLAQHLAAGAAPPARRHEVLEVVRLVEETARALHAAHEAGVLHRDVKPGNILLDQDRRPVIADFGLARDESGEGAGTLSGDRLGTPAYRSPEQITSGLAAVDRRSDIYALGVTLYEALTLRRPFDERSAPELERAIVRGDPPRPRQWNRALPRDLDVVVTTAIDRDPARRYRTAQDFAEDLRRVRERVPIRARPAGPWLRARRWVERSPVAAAALASVVLALATALTTTLVLLGRARAESVARERALIAVGQARSRAEAGFAGAIDAADHMLTRVAMDAFYDAPGTEVVGRKLLEDARDLCREFIDSHGGDSRLREQMGRACLNLGRFTSSLEGYAAALPHLEEGLWMLAPFATGPPETVRVLAELHETMALQLANLGRASPADAHHAVAAALREELLARAPHDRSLAIAAVHGDYLEGNECLVLGRKRDAERCFLRLLVRCERLAGAHDPAEPYVRVHALLALAMALGEPRNAEAQEYCCQAIAELEALPKHTLELESKLALAWEMNGALLEKAGDLPGAASALRNALRCLAEPGPHAPPGSVRWIRIMRARYWSKLAVILHQTGAPLETEAAWEAAFEHESEVFAQPQGNPAEAFELTDVCVRWAMIHAEGRGWDARSEAGVRNALELREQQLRRHPEQPHAWQRCAEAHELLGRFERRPVEAEDHLRRALELHDRGLAVSEGEWWTRLTRAEFLLRLGKHRTSQGRRVDAERCLTLADEECEQLGRERPADRRRVRVHANVLEKLAFSVESYSRMEAVLVRLVELLQRFLKDNDPDLDQMRYWTAAGRLATIRWTFLRGIEARGQLREVVRWFREEVRREPRHVAARIELALALGSLALGHEQRGNLEEALETVQETQKQLYEVAALAPREPRWRDPLREGHRLYVQLLQREGDVRAVLAETDRLLAVDPGSVEDAWTAAVALGRSAGNRSADPDDAGVYAAKALAALREAVHRGLRDSARIQLERALDSLREREDFQRLVRALRPDAR